MADQHEDPTPDSKVKTNITIDRDILDRLDRAADDRGLSRWRLAELILDEGLGRLRPPADGLFE